MNNIKKYFSKGGSIFAFVLILTIFSCQEKKYEGSSINMGFDEAIHRVNLSDIGKRMEDDPVSLKNYFSETEFVRLQSSDSAFIGNVDKMIIEDDRIYIGDYTASKAIFIFDMKGHLIASIDKIGKGPSEHTSIYDFTINTKDGKLCLLDLDERKVNYFDLEGTFLYEKSIPFLFSNFESLNDDYFLVENYATNSASLRKTGRYHVLKTTMSGDVDLKSHEYEPNFEEFSLDDSNMRLKNLNDNLYYRPRWCNLVYKYEVDSMIPYYYLDFGKQGIDYDFVTSIGISQMGELLDQLRSKPNFRGDFAESGDLAVFAIWYENRIGYCFYNKLTGQTDFASSFRVDDVFSLAFRGPLYSYGNGIATVLSTDKLVGFADFPVTMGKGQKVEEINSELFSGLDFSHNPVVFLFKGTNNQ